MGLLNKRNIAMAKKFADKNKDKIASGVKKATHTIDEKTGGKHADKLKKLDDAAQKFAGADESSATPPAHPTPGPLAPDVPGPGTPAPSATGPDAPAADRQDHPPTP